MSSSETNQLAKFVSSKNISLVRDVPVNIGAEQALLEQYSQTIWPLKS